MVVHREDGTMFEPFIPVLEGQRYMCCTLSIGSAAQCLWKIDQYESSGQ